MELSHAKKVLKNVLKELESVSRNDEFEFDPKNAEEVFEASEMLIIADKLSDVVKSLKYLDKPILAEGLLKKGSNGRYTIQGANHELTSGYIIEAWNDEDGFCKTRIEHKDGDYYAVGFEKQPLNGLRVRIRAFN